MLKKTPILLITLLLCATLCYACGRKDENQNDVFVDENSGNKIVGEKDVDEIPGINPQTTYAGESESQEDMELDENDANWDDDSDLIEKINKYMIPEQSFDVTLNGWGEVTFVSCRPMPDSEGVKNPCSDVSFYLISGEKVIYRFPYVNVLENDIYVRDDNIRQWGLIDSSYGEISFVMFTDVNGDDKDDVIIGIFYCTGAGEQGAIPRIEVRIYEDNGDEFVYDSNQCNELQDMPYDTTAGDVKALLDQKGKLESNETWQDGEPLESGNKYFIAEDEKIDNDETKYGHIKQEHEDFQAQNGNNIFYYDMECFYFDAAYPVVLNETLQNFYNSKKEAYRHDSEIYADEAYRDAPNVPFDNLIFQGVTYAGDDYVSLLFNDVNYEGGAHPYSVLDGITIDCSTGEIVTVDRFIDDSNEEIEEQIKAVLGKIVYTPEEWDYYITDKTVVFFYHDPRFWTSVATKRLK